MGHDPTLERRAFSASPESARLEGTDIRDIDPRLRLAALLSSIRHVNKAPVRAVTRWSLRRWPSPKVAGVRIRVARAGAATLRVYEPVGTGIRPALLWIHGGGLVVGSARRDDGLCARTATRLNAVVVSVDYRLAPEHPYPAAVDDVLSGWEWLLANADALGVDTARLAIGGESAGGGLAACLVAAGAAGAPVRLTHPRRRGTGVRVAVVVGSGEGIPPRRPPRAGRTRFGWRSWRCRARGGRHDCHPSAGTSDAGARAHARRGMRVSVD